MVHGISFTTTVTRGPHKHHFFGPIQMILQSINKKTPLKSCDTNLQKNVYKWCLKVFKWDIFHYITYEFSYHKKNNDKGF